MHKIKSSIYIESTESPELSAHALSANITTRQGLKLHIAAVSQKKPGKYTEIDTPRKTLLAFVTSLQNGGDRSVEKLIDRAIGLVTISTGSYIKRRGGAPCGMAAAILHDDQLYTIQIGAGEILQCHAEKFTLLTAHKADTQRPEPKWLGESTEFPLESINFRKNRFLPNSTILVCQPAFLRAVKNDKIAFKACINNLANGSEDFATDLARWGMQNGISTGLTMGVHHLNDGGRIQFEEAPAVAEPLKDPARPIQRSEPIIAPTGISYDGVELELGDKLISKVVFDAQLKKENEQTHAAVDQESQENLDKKSKPFVEIAKEFVEEIIEDASVNDTIRTTALDISPPVPIRTSGIVESHPVRFGGDVTLAETTETQADRPVGSDTEAKSGRYYRLMTIGSVGLFLTMIVLGIVVVFQRVVLTTVEAGEPISGEVSAENVEPGSLAPTAGERLEIGTWSQGSSANSNLLYTDEALAARGLVHFSLSSDNGTDSKNIFLWPGSKINFDHEAVGTSFALEEDSTLFIDSTQGTVRPELTSLFGVAESSAGCMSVNYQSSSEPLVISCYAGSCRWLGPLNRTYEIPAGERLALDSNLRAESPATFEPIYFTETAVFARTMGGVPAGQAIANQCLEPYLAEGQQLTADQTSAVVGAMSLNIAQEIGFWRIGNSPKLNELGQGETVNIRGLTHFTLQAVVDNQAAEHSVYAWPGSELHFDPELDDNQFDVAGGSALFLNSTDSLIRPFFPDLFGTAESSDGCMAITFPSAEKPLALSCYSGTCSWKGALNRNYNIPIGQRLELASNPRVENPAVLEPIRRTETAVIARTLGSIQAGLEISNRCVEPYLINPERVIVVPLATSTPLPTAEPSAPSPTPPPLETPIETFEETPDEITGVNNEAGEATETPEPEVDATPDNLIGS